VSAQVSGLRRVTIAASEVAWPNLAAPNSLPKSDSFRYLDVHDINIAKDSTTGRLPSCSAVFIDHAGQPGELLHTESLAGVAQQAEQPSCKRSAEELLSC
jgi:hypothetical protein